MNFQNIYTFTYQNTLLHTLLWFFFKTNHSNSKCQIWQALNNGLKWHMTCVFLFCVKTFSQSIFICTINLLKFCEFPVQTVLGVQLGFRTK